MEDPLKIERDARLVDARAEDASTATNAKRRVRLNPPFPYLVRPPDFALVGFANPPAGPRATTRLEFTVTTQQRAEGDLPQLVQIQNKRG